MEGEKYYSLPKLPYSYKDLAPSISEEQLTIHHGMHHLAYVNGANAIFEKLEKARKGNVDLDMKSTLKELSFHIGGHRLHSLFWQNMAPTGEGGGAPGGRLGDEIEKEFGTFDRFKKEFSQVANSTEGSGWAALAFCRETQRPLVVQIEKHNVNLYPGFKILMVLDAFWNIVNWDFVNSRLEKIRK